MKRPSILVEAARTEARELVNALRLLICDTPRPRAMTRTPPRERLVHMWDDVSFPPYTEIHVLARISGPEDASRPL